MRVDWLVVGIAGATCSGKTTLAKRLRENFENSLIISQDKYFLPPEDSRHTPVPELNHLNWELMTSLDMTKMIRDIENLFASRSNNDNERKRRILILDGFLLFNCKKIVEFCDLRYFLDMSKDECWNRRKLRVYEPPDVPGYFERVVWPEYVKSRMEILRDKSLCESIIFIDGTRNEEETFARVFEDIENKIMSISVTDQ